MLALNHNSLLIDPNMLTLPKSNLVEFVKRYSRIIFTLYRVRSFITNINHNLDLYLKLNKIDTPEKITELLEILEEISDLYEEINEEFNHFYLAPIKYMLNKTEDANMSLQSLLAAKEAELMSIG